MKFEHQGFFCAPFALGRGGLISYVWMPFFRMCQNATGADITRLREGRL